MNFFVNIVNVEMFITVAAAAATAKIQAMDAVASNAVVLGLSNLSKTPAPVTTVTSPAVVLPLGVTAVTAPVTLTSLPVASTTVIPPPGIAIPQITPDKKIQPAIVTPIVNAPQVCFKFISKLCNFDSFAF